MFARIAKQLREKHSLSDAKNRTKTVLVENNIIDILSYFEVNKNKSIRNCVEDLGFSHGTIQRVLRTNGYKPYKVIPMQSLREQDREKRLAFCQSMLRKHEEDPHFINNILFTDESPFSTAGRHNRRNTHVWATENPHAVAAIENQGYRILNVWCGMTCRRILGPIFLEGSLTGDRYLRYLQNEIRDFTQNQPNIIWQQDGAPPHNARQVREYLDATYATWIGTHGPIAWPPRSPDLNPLDFFLWGTLKQKIYGDGSNTLESLQNKIETQIRELNTNFQELQTVRNNFLKRMRLCVQHNGSHFEQFLH